MSFGFDLTKVDVETSERGPLPQGRYIATVEKVEKKSSKKNEANKYLNIMYKVCDMDKRNGAVFFDVVNIHNQNEVAQNIGRKRLKSMFVAMGAEENTINDLGPEWLVGKKVECEIGVEKDAEYGDKNKVFIVSAVPSKTGVKNDFIDKDKQLPDWL